MTALPHRLRSQNTATSSNSGRLRPANGTYRVHGPAQKDDFHLRSLPPTLFRLRNLNVPQSDVAASVTYESETSSPEMDYALAPERGEQSPTNSVNPLQNETRDIASSETTHRSLVSRLSSQSLVLFVILAIAITGIVIGNRGGEEVTENESSLNVSLLADSDSVPVEAGSESVSVDAVVSGDVASAYDNEGPSSSSATTHADLASTTTSDSLNPKAMLQEQSANAASTDSATSDVEAEMLNSGNLPVYATASPTLPPIISKDATIASPATTNSVNPAQVNLGTPTSLASSKIAVATSPVEPSEDAQVVNVVAADGQVPSSQTTSGYVQTQTPAGINDWLQYLPSINLQSTQPATVAVSDTPRSPIASYQQYLDSTSPGNTQATAPVGYLQDTYENYPNDTVGTQAQLPVSTSSTQIR